MLDRDPLTVPTIRMSPSRFAPFDTRSDVAAAARDESHRLLWCNETYASTVGASVDSLKGSDLRSLFGNLFADERAELIAPAIEREALVSYDQVVRGSRFLTRIFPLDSAEFSVRGYFVLAEPCSTSNPMRGGQTLRSAKHADLGELAALTRRELEIFRLLAEGLTGAEIASELHRSHKTIEFHTARILHALSLRSRTELARMAAERGLMGFSREAWNDVAQGRVPAARRASTKNQG